MVSLFRILNWQLFILLIFSTFFLPHPVQAKFYVNTADSKAVVGAEKTLSIFLVSETVNLTAVQSVLNFDSSYLNGYSLSTQGSKCRSSFTLADPSLGLGNNFQTPGFALGSKAIMSCGFPNPGYLSSNSTGDLVLRVTFFPKKTGTTTLSFSDLKYLTGPGNTASSSASPSYNLTIYDSTASAYGWVTSTPTPVPQATITGSDLTFVEVGSGNTVATTTTSSEDSVLQVVEPDDSIPPPPDMERRPSATPFVLSLLQPHQTPEANPEGEVLAVQSLRELLIPGKSTADKTVVLINIISVLTFIVILAIVLWRLIIIQKTNKLRTKHMTDLITSEISMLQSKMSLTENPEGREKLRQELDEAMKKVSRSSK